MAQKKQTRTRIISIASGKGGVGKSNIIINLGLALEELGERVLLLDVDLGMANIGVLLGLNPVYDLSDFFQDRCGLEEVVVPGPGGIDILPGISGVQELVNIGSRNIYKLLDASSGLEEKYDFILLDIGAGGNKSVVNFILAADETIIVLTPEPTAIMDAYSLLKILDKYNFSNQLGLIVNMVSSIFEGRRVSDRMSEVIEEYLKFNVKVLGYIPYDQSVKESVRQQNAFLTLYPDSKAGESIINIAQNIFENRKMSDSRGMKGFIYRMAGIFNRNL